MLVGECCNRMVVLCDRKTSVADTARLMQRHNVSCVVVVDQSAGINRPVGIVTDRDLVFKVLTRSTPEKVLLADLISDELPTARVDDGVWETMERMRMRAFRRLAVVNRQGSLEGLLAIDDLLDLLSEAQRGVARLARADCDAERGYVTGLALPRVSGAASPGVAEWARVA